jgi:hypothetical protein
MHIVVYCNAAKKAEWRKVHNILKFVFYLFIVIIEFDMRERLF